MTLRQGHRSAAAFVLVSAILAPLLVALADGIPTGVSCYDGGPYDYGFIDRIDWTHAGAAVVVLAVTAWVAVAAQRAEVPRPRARALLALGTLGLLLALPASYLWLSVQATGPYAC